MTHASALTALLLTLFALGGCGGDEGTPPPPPKADASPADVCTDNELRQLGEYMVQNNVWNKGTTTGYRQCVGVKAPTAGTGVDVAFDWFWPGASTSVRSYPQVIYGQKPWYDSTSTRLPRVVDEVKTAKAAFGYQVRHDAGESTGNLTFDIWLTTSNVRSGAENNLPLSHELMILLDSWGGYQPPGVKIDTVDIGGVSWDLYAMTATWGTSPWELRMYAPKTPLVSPYSIDVRLFLDHLKKTGHITGKEWLASLELGNEVIRGGGSTRLSNLTVTVE